ncbi:hypothetical protein Clacol_002312 [Clathrus columnatus]|uniref:Major facilitator superfamily (MFS) profile domain-containing protein n=1 Tax=Clathrus columnatus TaxID=1419009 RepID=A0AAV5A4D1_9AGAM|nr:hypothetical protein Clacol_002312 [Clathrus columnatus]
MGRAFNIFTAFFAAIGNTIAALTGAVVATFTGGCFFGALGAGWMSDKYGRKLTIQMGCVWALWGCSMQAGASNIACLLIGRIVAGVAIGILSMVVPLYNTEIAPAEIRGFIVGLAQQMVGLGFIAANWRWLLEQGREEEAHKIILFLHSDGKDDSTAKSIAEKEFEAMRDTIRAEKFVRSRKISDLWSTPAMLRRTLVACGVQIMGQFTGINVINYFGPQMYKALGLPANQLLLVQGIYGAIGPIANFFFIVFALDSVGRKKPLMFGAGMLVLLFSALSAIVASFPPGVGNPNLAAQKAGIAMIFLMSVVFSLSFGPISWVLASEVFPTRTRAIGTSAATCANWLLNVLFSEASPVALQKITWKYYMVFVVLNLIDFFVIAFLFPETKGKTLEEMAVVFGDQVDVGNVLDNGGGGGEDVKNHGGGDEKGSM